MLDEMKNSVYQLNEYLMILWSGLLLCSSDEKQSRFIRKLLSMVETGIQSSEGKKWFEKCFS